MFFYCLLTNIQPKRYFFILQIFFTAQQKHSFTLFRKRTDKRGYLLFYLFQQQIVMLVIRQYFPVDQFIQHIDMIRL